MNALTQVTTSLEIPENWFARHPNVVSKDANDVIGWCDICGSMKPTVCKNGYMRRECSHQQREREIARSRKENAVGVRCYTWLGNQAGDLEHKTFENFNPKAQARDCLQFKQHLADARSYSVKIELGDAAGNLLLKGDYGVGKTHLAAAILNRLRGEHIGGLFCSVQDLFEELYASDFERKHSILAQASSTRVLVLDDIDKLYTSQQGGGEYQQGILHSIIDRRYLARLSTIITTNVEDDLSRWLKPATLSRLNERMTRLSMHGIDYRARGQG